MMLAVGAQRRHRTSLHRTGGVRQAFLVAALACAVAVAAGGHGSTQLAAFAVVAAFAGIAFFALCVARPVQVLLVAWPIFVLQQPLGAYLGNASSFAGIVAGRLDDATLVVLAAAVCVRRLIGADRPRPSLAMPAALTALVVLALGFVSAVELSDVGPWSFVGAWLSLKFWIVLAAVCAMPWKPSDRRRVTQIVSVTALVVAALGVVDYVAPAVLESVLHTPPHEVDPSEPARSHAVQSVFASPSRYSNFMTVAVAASLGTFAVGSKRKDLVLALIFALAGLASLRLRGLLALVAIVSVLIVMLREGRAKRVVQLASISVLCLIVLGSSASAFTEQLTKFTSETASTTRGQLYGNALHLASQHAPLGVGFGRYGSYASSLYYSPYYDTLHMSQIWGFSQEQPFFLTDTSWSGFVAETGYAGASILALSLMLFGIRLTRQFKRTEGDRRTSALIALGLLAAAVTMSTGSAAMLDSVVVSLIAMYAGCAFAREAAA